LNNPRGSEIYLGAEFDKGDIKSLAVNAYVYDDHKGLNNSINMTRITTIECPL
jgi:hypothetical protein